MFVIEYCHISGQVVQDFFVKIFLTFQFFFGRFSFGNVQHKSGEYTGAVFGLVREGGGHGSPDNTATRYNQPGLVKIVFQCFFGELILFGNPVFIIRMN